MTTAAGWGAQADGQQSRQLLAWPVRRAACHRDHVVDHYLEVTDLVENDIDAMEENVFSPNSVTNVEHIYLLKREVVEMRRAVTR